MSTPSSCSTLTWTLRGGEVLLATRASTRGPCVRAAMPRRCPDDGSVVFDADQQPAAVTVCEAHHGLGELVVVCVTLEFDGVCLTAGDQLFEVVRHHGEIIRDCLRFTNSGTQVRISL